MSDYNIQMHEYNGAGYDNLYPKTKSNMVLDGDTNLETKLKYYSNENLLDNWYFVGGGSQQGGEQFPINQREQTSYSGTGYGIDRWYKYYWNSTNPVLLMKPDCITLKNETGEGVPNSIYIGQKIDNPSKYSNKTITFSVIVSRLINTSAVLFAFTGNESNPIGLGSLANGLNSVTWTVPENTTELSFGIGLHSSLGGNGSIDFDIVAVKLELGDTQTLAHQDANGNWVLNEIPNYHEQLARCQRYQYVYNLGHQGPQFDAFVNGSILKGDLYFPVQMRVTPTVSFVGARMRDNANGNYVDFVSEPSLFMTPRGIFLFHNMDSSVFDAALTDGHYYSIVSTVLFDANL